MISSWDPKCHYICGGPFSKSVTFTRKVPQVRPWVLPFGCYHSTHYNWTVTIRHNHILCPLWMMPDSDNHPLGSSVDVWTKDMQKEDTSNGVERKPRDPERRQSAETMSKRHEVGRQQVSSQSDNQAKPHPENSDNATTSLSRHTIFIDVRQNVSLSLSFFLFVSFHCNILECV